MSSKTPLKPSLCSEQVLYSTAPTRTDLDAQLPATRVVMAVGSALWGRPLPAGNTRYCCSCSVSKVVTSFSCGLLLYRHWHLTLSFPYKLIAALRTLLVICTVGCANQI